MIQLTATEQKLFDLLKDGQRHHKTEMYELLDMLPDESDNGALRAHIHRLREKLAGQGLQIIVESYRRRGYYLLVRNVASAYE